MIWDGVIRTNGTREPRSWTISKNSTPIRTRERWIVAWISGLLTCLLIAGIAYLVLRPIHNSLHGTTASNSSVITRSIAWGIHSGLVVGTEFFVYTSWRPTTNHRVIHALIAGISAIFLFSCCGMMTWLGFGAGDLPDNILGSGLQRWLEKRRVEEEVNHFLFAIAAVTCGLQVAGHIFLWYRDMKE